MRTRYVTRAAVVAAVLALGGGAAASPVDPRTLGYLEAALTFCSEADPEHADKYQERLEAGAVLDDDKEAARKTAEYQQGREAMQEQLAEAGRVRAEALWRSALE
jgi:hypothetical protein